MSTEANKGLIHRYIAAVDRGDVRALDEFIAPHFVDHSPFPGTTGDLAGLRQAFAIFQKGVPGTHTIDDLIAEGDKVAGRITGFGTHSGEFMGIPATGKKVQVAGIAIWRIENGRIVEHWSQVDSLGLMQQLGAMPAVT
jgi:steroid delta-isomerase-like uncharacterized protein